MLLERCLNQRLILVGTRRKLLYLRTSSSVTDCFCLDSVAMASGALKKTTGLTGLAVAKHPHYTLGVLYGKILRALQKMPPDAAYRKYTEDIVTERAKIVETTQDVAEVERKIGCGQLEEVIMQAENELKLARKMVGWKAWEPLLRKPPPDQWAWPPTKSEK